MQYLDSGPRPTEEQLRNRLMLINQRLNCKPILCELPADLDGLVDEMRCSFCKNIVPAPLKKACEVGHIICTDCQMEVPYCPWEPANPIDTRNMCRRRFVNITIRLYDYVYLKSRFECRFKSLGCEVTPLGSEWKDHFKECPLRPPAVREPNQFNSHDESHQ